MGVAGILRIRGILQRRTYCLKIFLRCYGQEIGVNFFSILYGRILWRSLITFRLHKNWSFCFYICWNQFYWTNKCVSKKLFNLSREALSLFKSKSDPTAYKHFKDGLWLVEILLKKFEKFFEKIWNLKFWKNFLNTMQKNSPENSFPLTRNRKKWNDFNSVMTSMTVLLKVKIHLNSVWIRPISKLCGF